MAKKSKKYESTPIDLDEEKNSSFEGESSEGTCDEEVEREPKKKVKPTLVSHLEKYEELMTALDDAILTMSKERIRGVRTLQRVRKMVAVLKKEVPKIAKGKFKIKNPNRKNGFSVPCKISRELAEFIGVDADSTETLSRVEVMTAIRAYIHIKPDETRGEVLRWQYLNPGRKRNLQDPENGMIVHPDEKLSELLGYPKYKKRVKAGKEMMKHKSKDGETTLIPITDPSLKYWVITRLIGKHIERSEKKERSERSEKSDESGGSKKKKKKGASKRKGRK